MSMPPRPFANRLADHRAVEIPAELEGDARVRFVAKVAAAAQRQAALANRSDAVLRVTGDILEQDGRILIPHEPAASADPAAVTSATERPELEALWWLTWAGTRALSATAAEGVPHGSLVQYAVLFDRLFRFPITGERMRNYDGLGGQLLFAYLHQNNVIQWTDNRLTVDWAALPDAVVALHEQVSRLYHDGIDRSKVAQWLAAYELMSSYVPPNPASAWAGGAAVLPMSAEPKELVDLVLPDEFPLSTFYEALRRKLGATVAATAGITA